MSDKNLAHALAAAAEYEASIAPARHSQRADACPSVDRLAREYSSGLSVDVRAHLDGCGHCRKLLARIGELDRKDSAGPRTLSFPPVRLNNPAAKAAKTTGSLLPLAKVDEGPLTVELLQVENSLRLSVRTKDSDYASQLVRYAFRTEDGAEAGVGFALLRSDQNDWFTAHVRFDAAELFAKVNGVCQPVVRVAPPLAAVLKDSATLLECVRQDRASGQDEAWRVWGNAQLDRLPAEADAQRQLLNEVRQLLTG